MSVTGLYNNIINITAAKSADGLASVTAQVVMDVLETVPASEREDKARICVNELSRRERIDLAGAMAMVYRIAGYGEVGA